MESILEHQRVLHEERERIVDAMTKEGLRKKAAARDQTNGDHRMKQWRDRYMEISMRVCELYEDRDNQRKQEITALSGPNEFGEFYNRLQNVREFYKKHPNEIVVPMSVEFDQIEQALDDGEKVEENLVPFSGEEGYGKYLDLHECFVKYTNLKGIEKVDYLTYLSTFDRLFEIPKEKKTQEYKKYVEAVLDYLKDFLNRAKPLLDLEDEVRLKLLDFNREWENGTFPGWTKPTGGGALAHTGAYLDLSPFSSPEELMSLGLDRLKSALMALGLKCGGTLEERAVRLFSTKGKRLQDLDQSLLAKPAKSAAAPSKDPVQSNKYREIAALESQLYKLVELVSEQRAATKENVERKQARTVGEEEAEEEQEIVVEEEPGSDDEDDIPYNPKNLPLGWDGKPIPYWLYKLHGLNISYPCEICGNQVYKGPKAFQRHFSEWRHAHGMRCLGIPNTAHFANITKIKDAVELWKKLKDDKEQTVFKAEYEEEFEDTFGNVVTRRTFEDLRRQGLL